MRTNLTSNSLSLLCAASTLALADPLGTGFTYQGRLTDSGGPATGLYDFQFLLCDAATNGVALGTNAVAAAPVTNGLYNVALDFGANAFDGNARWLALSVRTNGGTIWTALTPRLGLTPTPYAIRATTAGVVSGPIPDSQLSPNIARLNGTNTFTGPVSAPNFSGSGGTVTGVNAASLGGQSASAFWQLGGNTATIPGTSFLGTADNQPLEIRVNNQRALRLEPDPRGPNVIAGSPYNFISGGAFGATIAGGGPNTNYAILSFIGSGGNNSILGSSSYSSIVGGDANTVGPDSLRSVVGGGQNNLINTQAIYSVIGGGINNVIRPHAYAAVIPGGQENGVSGDCSFAAGFRAKADHAGSFVWADQTGTTFSSTGPNQFLIRARGGVRLDDPGTSLFFGATSRQEINLYYDSTGIGTQTDTLYFRNAGGFAWFQGGQHAYGANDPGPGGAVLMALAPSGNLGIGTAGPQTKLDVYRSTTVAMSLRTDTQRFDLWNNGSRLDVGDGVSSTFLSVLNSGNVGIGTTSPQCLLQVGVDTDTVKTPLRVGNVDYGSNTVMWVAPGSVYFDAPGVIGGRLSILGGTGNVGIGTPSPSAKLDVNGTVKAATFVGSGSGISSISPGSIASGTVTASLQFSAPPIFPSGFSVGSPAKVSNLNADLLDGLDSTYFISRYGDTMTGPLTLQANGLAAGGTQLVLANGYVGVGTSNPQATLDVHGTTRTCVLSITGGCDLAEPFPLATQEIPKGSVVVIDDEHPGQLKQSTEAYDQRVAGIVSGANGINPGITLSQQGALEGGQNVALSGRVYVLADASNGPIKPGDMLTTSDVPGHAMKVIDHAKAQGAILGKAMSRLPEGRGLVLVLVTLQ